VLPCVTRRHDAVSDELKPPVREAVRSSVASVTTLPSSNFWVVPFRPVVVERPPSLPDAEGLVLKGCGSPTGDASNRAIGGPAAIENPAARDFFLAADGLGFTFCAGFFFVVRVGFFATDFFAINQNLRKNTWKRVSANRGPGSKNPAFRNCSR
jgi:hypothetical protein